MGDKIGDVIVAVGDVTIIVGDCDTDILTVDWVSRVVEFILNEVAFCLGDIVVSKIKTFSVEGRLCVPIARSVNVDLESRVEVLVGWRVLVEMTSGLLMDTSGPMVDTTIVLKMDLEI